MKIDKSGWKGINWMNNDEREWKWMEVVECGRNRMKLDENWRKLMKVDENEWKWMKVDESDWKWMKLDWKWMKGVENIRGATCISNAVIFFSCHTHISYNTDLGLNITTTTKSCFSVIYLSNKHISIFCVLSSRIHRRVQICSWKYGKVQPYIYGPDQLTALC